MLPADSTPAHASALAIPTADSPIALFFAHGTPLAYMRNWAANGHDMARVPMELRPKGASLPDVGRTPLRGGRDIALVPATTGDDAIADWAIAAVVRHAYNTGAHPSPSQIAAAAARLAAPSDNVSL